ncbi:PfkB family carbohydrate kinase [[Eubacterium] cellulosolvens]
MSFLVIGNITKDLIKTRRMERNLFGGTSFAGLIARKLGYESSILTKGNYKLEEWISYLGKNGIQVLLQEDEQTASFVNDYSSIDRKQSLLEFTKKIVFDIQKDFDIIHFNPVYQEIDLDLVKNARKKCRYLSLDVQGLVREQEDRKIQGRFWIEREDWLKYLDFLKVGKNEINLISRLKNYEKICEELKSFGVKTIALTFGRDGSIIYYNQSYKIPAFETNTIDETGAGDVFGSSFAIKHYETGNIIEAALFATASASFVVEDFGTIGIANKEVIEQRYNKLKSIL